LSTTVSKSASANTMFGFLPPSSTRDPLHGRGGRPDDRLPGGEAAGEADHVDVRVRGERRADGRPGAEQDVDHARGTPASSTSRTSSTEVSGVTSLGLDHAGAARSERGRELPRQLQERVVPRGDEHADAHRLVRDPRQHVGLPDVDRAPFLGTAMSA
jgi:hypothetical protein